MEKSITDIISISQGHVDSIYKFIYIKDTYYYYGCGYVDEVQMSAQLLNENDMMPLEYPVEKKG